MIKFVLWISSFLILSSAWAGSADDPPKLMQVEAGIYRSGRPTQAGIDSLKSRYGIQTIINVEDAMSNVTQEKDWADQQGIKYYSFPLNSFSTPDDATVDRILAMLKDPSLQPILIHCKHGEDRTGFLIGLHRVFVDGWTPKKAYQEMLDLGFHSVLRKLDAYYKKKSGYNLSVESLDLSGVNSAAGF